MTRHITPAAVAIAAAFIAVPSAPFAQESTPTSTADAERKQLEEEIRREMGKSTQPRAPEVRIAAQGYAGQGGNPAARLMLLPDISAIGSLNATWNDQTEKLDFAFEELELALQAVVDPYVRADIFVAFAEGTAEVEEAYVTTLSMPAGLQIRAGQMRSPFGRLNQTHPHVQEFVEAPLATRLLAEEALSGAGVDLAWLAPLPWFAELHLALQSVAPTEEDRANLAGVARLAQYFPLGEAATLGVGLSAARRDEGVPGQFRDLAGADLYLRIRPPDSRSYLALTGELYARRFIGIPDVSEDFEKGWWAQAFWRIGRFVGVGARYERAPAEEVEGDEERVIGLLAWLPSEFQRIRLEVSRDTLPGGEDVVTAFLNLEFGIGAHGAHPF